MLRNIDGKEAKYIIKKLGREPNELEWGMIDIMWSEHISYKSSKYYLKKYLRSHGKYVVVGPGQDAGVVKIGNFFVSFKIESHNHPSAIDPYGGAATGVGGIVRDILSMGARPIATLDSLHFGDVKNQRTWFHIYGVVRGISDYGNRIGVPTVGGETKFAECYGKNPLVNVACVGVSNDIVPSLVTEPDLLLVLYGNRTGRDGLHGVSFASEIIDEESESERSAVQIGDPFTEKLLIEATLEIVEKGLAIAIKDLGGGGLTCAISEMVGKGGVGAEVDISKVPLREENMKPYEIMLSESQERMLLATRKENIAKISKILEKYDLTWSVIGRTIKERILLIKEGKNVLAKLPVEILVNTPIKRHKTKLKTSVFVEKDDPEFNPPSLDEAVFGMMQNPNLKSKRWIFEQYDYEVQIRTVIKPGSDAAVLRISENEGIAVTLDSCADYASLNPYEGAKSAVAEAYRNITAVGGEPIAIVDNINAGDPNNPTSYFAFKETVRGLGNAARAFQIPVIGGNVSLYNESPEGAIWPTVVVGMLGKANPTKVVDISLKNENSYLVLVGNTRNEMGGSEYYKFLSLHGYGRVPRVMYKEEIVNSKRVRKVIRENMVLSAHDISDGGLLFSLIEMALAGNRGVEVAIKTPLRYDFYAFSESHARYILEVSEEYLDEVLKITKGKTIGKTTNTNSLYVRINDAEFDVSLSDLGNSYDWNP